MCPMKAFVVFVYSPHFVPVQHFQFFFIPKNVQFVTLFKMVYKMTHLYVQKSRVSNPLPTAFDIHLILRYLLESNAHGILVCDLQRNSLFQLSMPNNFPVIIRLGQIIVFTLQCTFILYNVYLKFDHILTYLVKCIFSQYNSYSDHSII